MKFDISKHFQEYRINVFNGLHMVSVPELEKAFDILSMAAQPKWSGRTFVCGNGGSASIAEHWSCDHFKGVQSDTELKPNVISLSSNMALITAIANDYGYDNVFMEQLSMYEASPADVLVLVSSSGNSRNIIEAYEFARNRFCRTISLVGFDGGEILKQHLARIQDHNVLQHAVLHVAAKNYGIVEDCHQILMHTLAQALRISRACIPIQKL